MQTDIRAGAKVQTQKGEALGDIKHLVMQKDSKQVTHVVVGGEPYEGRMTLVEVSKIGNLSDDKTTVQLNLDREQFKQLPKFDEKAFYDSRNYPADVEPGVGKPSDTPDFEDPRRFFTGGYTLDPDAPLMPPGIVENTPKTTY